MSLTVKQKGKKRKMKRSSIKKRSARKNRDFGSYSVYVNLKCVKVHRRKDSSGVSEYRRCGVAAGYTEREREKVRGRQFTVASGYGRDL